ncbi:MAG: DASH family cryptochrome [Bacteroidota bacterium]
MASTGLIWFRNDLRVHDNHSIRKAIVSNDRVLSVYCFDPRHFGRSDFGFRKTEKFRAQFLIDSVGQLRENLEKRNIPLFVFFGTPEDTLPHFIAKHSVQSIYLQKEWTPEETSIEKALRTSDGMQTVIWTHTYDQFLFHPEGIPFDLNNIPDVFTNFRRKCERYATIKEEVRTDDVLPEENLLPNPTQIPTLEDLGFTSFEIDPRTAFPFKGGETEAANRLQDYFWNTRNLSVYKKTRNGLIGPDYSSKFSPWLANGSLSARTVYHKIKQYEAEVEKNESTYWLIFEMIWRDFFKYISLQYDNSIFKIGGILNKDYSWSTDSDLIKDWIDGKTPERFVNANMIELKNTGWMSNRGRQNVSSYFAKHLQLDWRIGAAYFESMLIDYDVHSNYGNWMYVAGVGNDPRDRQFNIKFQAERYDTNHIFQKLWLQDQMF